MESYYYRRGCLINDPNSDIKQFMNERYHLIELLDKINDTSINSYNNFRYLTFGYMNNMSQYHILRKRIIEKTLENFFNSQIYYYKNPKYLKCR